MRQPRRPIPSSLNFWRALIGRPSVKVSEVYGMLITGVAPVVQLAMLVTTT